MRATMLDTTQAGQGRRISLFGVGLLVLCHCASTTDVGGVEERVVDVDAELLTHFHDAALFCDRRIFSTIPLSSFGAESVGDAALVEYVQWRPAGTPSISTGPHAGETVSAAPCATNACYVPVSIEIGSQTSQIQDGFCRADFNYCLGMELTLHAQSLPSAAAYTPLKAAILRRARERLQAAGLEYVSSLGFYERACPGSAAPLAGYEFECGRLKPSEHAWTCGGTTPAENPGYLPVAHDRMVESVAQVASLAQTEAGLRVDAGDRALRETPLREPPPGAPSAAITALFGPDGTRTAGVSALYGPPEGVNFETDWNERRLEPVALPLYAPTDERAARTLELMRRYRVLTTFRRATTGGDIELVPTGAAIIAAYDVLDNRLAAERYLPPYDVVQPPDPATDMGTILRSRRPLSEPELDLLIEFAPHESILASEHQITLADVYAAILLATDAYETQFGRFVFEPQLTVTGADYLALVHATPRMRPVRMLASAFSDEAGPISADPQLPLLAPLPRDASGTATGDWYAWDLRRVDGTQDGAVSDEIAAPLGAAGALHLLRVHLLRLGTLGQGFIDHTKTSEALDLIEHAIGAVWTEYDTRWDSYCQCTGDPPVCPDRDEQPLYGPCSECSCHVVSPTSNLTRWDMYYPTELETVYAGGTPVVVYGVDDVRCLVDEKEPGSENECALTPPALSHVWGPVDARIGRVRRMYTLPTAPADVTHQYILWRNADGDHRLLDVVPVDQSVGVHPLGGVFLDAAATAWSRDPWRAASPTSSARGSIRGLVPPLESELISDSDAYEDSFARYLADARQAVSLARGQLAQARADELLARQNELNNQARMEEAAVVETGEIADLCGDTPGCIVERSAPVTLHQLGIVRDPPPVPADVGPDPEDAYASCDDALDALFSDFSAATSAGFMDDDEAEEFVTAHMTRALACTLHLYLTELGALHIEGLPLAVREALESGGSGEFTAYSGALREHLIAIFYALDAARNDMRRLESHRAAAEILIQTAAQEISYANLDQLERDLCVWEFALGLVADVASIVASVANASRSYTGASNSFGKANTFADTSPDTAREIYNGGIGAVRTGTDHVGDAVSSGGNIAHDIQGFIASDACQNQNAATTAGFRAAQELAISLGTIAALAESAHGTSRSTFFEISRIDSLARSAQFANRRRAVARLQAQSDSLADLPEWHSLRSFRQRRAEAALARAQHASYVARRAIEFRLAVDLSSMHAPEPLTPPPSSWADSLFGVSGAVLSLPDDEAEVSIAAEELDLYLSRLERFVDGYPLARRFRDGRDVQVLDLGALLEVDASMPITERMRLKCAAHPVALLGGRLPGTPAGAAPCEGTLGGVEYAEIDFAIPAELDTYLAERLAAGSFNYRHDFLAPNLVGVAVLDCEEALHPTECYGDGNIPYSLRHEGPFVLESFDRQLLTYSMEPGVIENGRALVAERSFTTPLSSVDRSFVTPFFRSELRGRPLSGLYSLRIEGRPEIRWQQLERVQLLLGYRYWTRQE